MMTRELVLFAALALALSMALPAQEIAREDSEPEPEATSEHAWTPGLIFATDSILLDMLAFNGGVGVALRSDDRALRGMLGWYASNVFFTTSLKTAVWYVDYFWTGRLSPYWTAFGRMDLLSRTIEIDEDNWTRESSFSLGAGGSLGVEFFLLDFLSLFAEYSLSVGTAGTREAISIRGEVMREEFEWRYTAGTALAHGGAMGMTVYLRPQVALAEPQAGR